MRKFLLASWLLMCVGVSPAHAAPFQVAIASSGTETIVDNGAGDLDLTVGILLGGGLFAGAIARRRRRQSLLRG